ncbi:hypothetical protein UC3_02017 [Enterococcus phoeniculicola ATCC BAA-412]|uniref:Uncharacterized protein n=1 Tax=Enterococcus phoeniculicola ATCC BAA-412 TaxID=1158610 RepID=R3WMI1_9ENTE|nr:hypothetical protein UC3_02017 [Enterococcus phoeniculicola ATCC BAA-412]EOT76602.1 hypothetical protein I589_01559 [Enterococcus phoeniculicola ATCC BAA-412]
MNFPQSRINAIQFSIILLVALLMLYGIIKKNKTLEVIWIFVVIFWMTLSVRLTNDSFWKIPLFLLDILIVPPFLVISGLQALIHGFLKRDILELCIASLLIPYCFITIRYPFLPVYPVLDLVLRIGICLLSAVSIGYEWKRRR